MLFREYHEKYPSHGYRWLNAKILLDTGQIMSDRYAYKCCRIADIRSESNHYRYKKPGDPYKVYPNLLMQGLNVDGPMQCVVSDMTAFRLHGTYYELTFYMDLQEQRGTHIFTVAKAWRQDDIHRRTRPVDRTEKDVSGDTHGASH